MDWQLWVRDSDRRWIGVVDDEHAFEGISRHLALGAWKLTVEARSPSADLLLEGAGVALLDSSGDVLLSGPKRPVERTNEGSSEGDTLTVSGVDDTAILSRIVYPSPNTAITTSGVKHSAAYWTATGPAETVIRNLVNANAGLGALADRRVPGLVLPPSLGRGATLTSQLRLDNLLETAWEIARAGGLGFHVVQDDASTDLLLRFYEPADLGDEIRFGAGIGNLAGYEYSASPPKVTDVIVAIGGEGTDRRFYRYQQRDPLWPDVVVEEVLDARDLSQEPGDGDEDWVDPDIVSRERAQERLAEGAAQASVSFEPIDTDSQRFGVDYGLGDIVTAEIDIGEVTDVIREVTYTRTPEDGETVRPSIGEPPNQPQIYKRVAQLRRDVDQLQRRR